MPAAHVLRKQSSPTFKLFPHLSFFAPSVRPAISPHPPASFVCSEKENAGHTPESRTVCLSHSLSMNHEANRFVKAGNTRTHRQGVHVEDVFKCPQPGFQFSTSWKASLAQHSKGFHGTAGSFACDHPGCTFQADKSTHNVCVSVYSNAKLTRS